MLQVICDGFVNLCSDFDMQLFVDVVCCCLEVDWFVGINGICVMIVFNSKGGGFFLIIVGCVQMLMLLIVVECEEKICCFILCDYWEVKVEFVCVGGFYEGKWFDLKFKCDEFDLEKCDFCLWSLLVVEMIVVVCCDQVGMVFEELKLLMQLLLLLFDLMSLQCEVNSCFGFFVKNMFGFVQVLYEKYKVLIYLCIDVCVLLEDYLLMVQFMFEMFKESYNYLLYVKQVFDKGWVKLNKWIFDNLKISDYFVIILMLQVLKLLFELEQKLYDMVVKCFFVVFFLVVEFCVMMCIIEVVGYYFKIEGKVFVELGWLQVYGCDVEGVDVNFVLVQKDEKVKMDEIVVVVFVIKLFVCYLEVMLLFVMEGVGKLVEDDELCEVMVVKGFGMLVMCVVIIEGLFGEKYLLCEGCELILIVKVFQLMMLLCGFGVKEFIVFEFIGEWEYKLLQMECGNFGCDVFMQEIVCMMQQIVKCVKEYDFDMIFGDYVMFEMLCLNCGGQVKENYCCFVCMKCDFLILKILGSWQFEILEVEELLQKKEIGLLFGFCSKMGCLFLVIFKLFFDDEMKNYKFEFDFGQDQGGEEGEVFDFFVQELVGVCLKCKGCVFEYGMSYVCEYLVVNLKICDFCLGKVIL